MLSEKFKCEICGVEAFKALEGSHPNTCANCMPLDNDIDMLRKRSSADLTNLPRELVKPLESPKNLKIWHNICFEDFSVDLEYDDYVNVIKSLLNKMSKEDLVELVFESIPNGELDYIFQEELKEMYKKDE